MAVRKPLTNWFQVGKRFVGCKVKSRLRRARLKKGNWLGNYFSRDERYYESLRLTKIWMWGPCGQNLGGLNLYSL